MNIVTNNHPREVVYGHELPEKWQKEYDYLADFQSERFVKYKGIYIHLGDFLTTQQVKGLEGWDGYLSDSYFSGLLVKFVEDEDFVVMGRYYS